MEIFALVLLIWLAVAFISGVIVGIRHQLGVRQSAIDAALLVLASAPGASGWAIVFVVVWIGKRIDKWLDAYLPEYRG
ncbi:hypothetical protein sos41_31480 [Alphaproteobacteria bacterium SO-S41]|nr:hypothetical protein sos41_31480 [Alphaproteobacteria bacterium SO-S41]